MAKDPRLRAISAGQASFEEAADALENAIENGAIEIAYSTLRDWTWKALHSKTIDKNLSDWINLIQGFKSKVPISKKEYKIRLEVLIDLIGISIKFSSTVADDNLLGYSHVPSIIIFIGSQNGHTSRQKIKEKFDIGESRLSQILSLLVHSGLLDRESRGREAYFTITNQGFVFLEKARSRSYSLVNDRSTIKEYFYYKNNPDLNLNQGSNFGHTSLAVKKPKIKSPTITSIDKFVSKTEISNKGNYIEARTAYQPPVNQVISDGENLE